MSERASKRLKRKNTSIGMLQAWLPGSGKNVFVMFHAYYIRYLPLKGEVRGRGIEKERNQEFINANDTHDLCPGAVLLKHRGPSSNPTELELDFFGGFFFFSSVMLIAGFCTSI